MQSSLVATFGLTDNLELTLPGLLTAHLGSDDGLALFPWGGVSGISIGYYDPGFGGASADLSLTIGTGLTVRHPVGHAGYLVAGVGAGSTGEWHSGHSSPLTTWKGALRFGYSVTLRSLVSFNIGVSASSLFLDHGSLIEPGRGTNDLAIGLGSVLSLGPRSLPLVQVHLTDIFSIDGYAAVAIRPNQVEDTYMIGATFAF